MNLIRFYLINILLLFVILFLLLLWDKSQHSEQYKSKDLVQKSSETPGSKVMSNSRFSDNILILPIT